MSISINEESETSQHQNVTFSDQTSQWEYTVDSQPDPTFNMADTDDASLENFFSRPIKIASYEWGTGNNIFETFNPWQLYFENARVINRITNFNLMRCKLKVRIMLNGNGFHFGRAICSYIPLHTDDQFTKDRAFFFQDIVGASQRPHIYLDPTKSQGGTITCPFVWYENALDIPDEDWRRMGDMIIHGMNPLKHANGAADSVTVSVFAWAEEMNLSIPTANEPGALSPQAGVLVEPKLEECTTQGGLLSKGPLCDIKIGDTTTTIKCCDKADEHVILTDLCDQAGALGKPDEYGNSPISTPALMVARAAGALRDAPIIGLYARATEIAAGAVGNVAKMFGYSRPVNLANIDPYKPTYLGNMANTNTPDTSTKLTLDAKQELTIDPRVMGLGSTDEMTICSIAKRESFLTQFPWAVADTTESLLWNTEVSPVTWIQNTGAGAATELHLPASCFAALPFRYWRGTMRYRFQIVASSFHKGRLKVVYDPSYPLTNEYNTNYTYVIDLAKERDFTVDVKWGQEFPYCGHRRPGTDTPPWSQNKLPADPQLFANGIISVYVVNELTVPNSTADNDIALNVFVSAGDDFEVINPDSSYIDGLSWCEPQGGELDFSSLDCQAGESPDGDETTNENTPISMEADVTMAAQLSTADHTTDVFFGDPVTSFRQCLKRYNFHSVMGGGPSNAVAGTLVQWNLNNLPQYRGYLPSAVDQDITSTPYEFAQMTLLNWIMPAYTCVRGGIRWKYHLMNYTNVNGSPFWVQRNPNPVNGAGVRTSLLGIGGTNSQIAHGYSTNVKNTWDGSHFTSSLQNPILEVELPFQDNERFWPGKKRDFNNNFTNSYFHGVNFVKNQSDDVQAVMRHVSVGEDFTCGFFTGCPVAYAQVDPVPQIV